MYIWVIFCHVEKVIKIKIKLKQNDIVTRSKKVSLMYCEMTFHEIELKKGFLTPLLLLIN